MKFNYYKETDSLYINLLEEKSVESFELSPGLVIDYDNKGRVVGIDIDQASKTVNLSNLETHSLPIVDLVMTK